MMPVITISQFKLAGFKVTLSRLYPLYLGQISEPEVTYLGLSCLLEKV